MDVRIDRNTGEITLGAIRIGRASTTRELQAIDPERFEKQPADGDNFFCNFADIDMGGRRLICQSYHRDGAVLFFTFEGPYAPGDSWDNASEEKEALKLAMLRKILVASGIADHEDFAWGHVGAGYDGRSGITALTVAYYQRVRSDGGAPLSEFADLRCCTRGSETGARAPSTSLDAHFDKKSESRNAQPDRCCEVTTPT